MHKQLIHNLLVSFNGQEYTAHGSIPGKARILRVSTSSPVAWFFVCWTCPGSQRQI